MLADTLILYSIPLAIGIVFCARFLAYFVYCYQAYKARKAHRLQQVRLQQAIAEQTAILFAEYRSQNTTNADEQESYDYSAPADYVF